MLFTPLKPQGSVSQRICSHINTFCGFTRVDYCIQIPECAERRINSPHSLKLYLAQSHYPSCLHCFKLSIWQVKAQCLQNTFNVFATTAVLSPPHQSISLNSSDSWMRWSTILYRFLVMYYFWVFMLLPASNLSLIFTSVCFLIFWFIIG